MLTNNLRDIEIKVLLHKNDNKDKIYKLGTLRKLMENERIVWENLAIMHSKKDGGLYPLTTDEESWGGNGGFFREKKFPCMVANFLYERQTGKIYRFTKGDDVTDEERSLYLEGALRIAIDVFGTREIAVVTRRTSPNQSELAGKNLEASVNRFNELHENFPFPEENGEI